MYYDHHLWCSHNNNSKLLLKYSWKFLPWKYDPWKFLCWKYFTFTDSPDSLEKIGVYWDIENCPVKNKSTAAVVKRIRDVYMPGRSEVEFVCVCDIRRQKKHFVDELNKAEVSNKQFCYFYMHQGIAQSKDS